MNEMPPLRPEPPKIDPATLVLRAQPRRVVRFRRNLVIGLAAAGCAGVFAATWAALQAPTLRRSTNAELYSIDRKPTPDGLAALPGSYDQIKQAAAPALGPPLPGDLGPPVVRQERSLGIAPAAAAPPNPYEQAAQAERLRAAEQARRAAEAGVFFQISRQDTIPPTLPTTRTSASASPSAVPATSTSAPRLNLDLERDQNDQQRKLDFVNEKQDDRAIYNPHDLQTPVSPYEVLAGTVIAASLMTGINSDLPGLVTAQVTENVYDSVTGRILLIPQGARLIGSYDSVVAFNQSRALLVWQRIVMPDGSSIVIDNLPASDTQGYSGLADEVDYHTWALLKGVALSTLLGVGGQLTFASEQSDLVQAIRESTQESTNQAGQKIVEKTLNIQPTITIRPGWPLRVVVHKDLLLRPYRGEGVASP